MEYLTLENLIIVLPMLFLAGFVDSIGGGGGLISMPALVFTGMPIHIVIGTNKLQSVFGTFVSTAKFMKEGYINLKVAIVGAITCFIGSGLGSSLALLIDDEILNKLMVFILPLVAILVLNKNLFKLKENTDFEVNTKTLILTFISCLVIGIYDGFYGPGTGTFLIIAFTILAKMDIRYANGHAKICNLATGISATAVYLLSGKVIIPLGILGAVFNIAGNYFGSKLAINNPSKVTRPTIIFVLFLLVLKVFKFI